MSHHPDIRLHAIKAGVIPNPQQILLLQACLLEGDAAADALKKWIGTLRTPTTPESVSAEPGLPQLYDQLDPGSQRLLSLLYKHCVRQGITDPIVRQLEGYYKYVWYRNHVLKAALTALVAGLTSIGVTPIVFKGVVETEKYYRDFGVRPTTDLDIIVLPEDVSKTVALLMANNWRSAFGDPHQISQSQIHAHTFKQGPVELDLHIRFAAYSLKPSTIASFWRESTMTDQGYKTLHPAHELFLTMLHAYQWNFIPPIRWVADSTMMIRSFSPGEWKVFRALVVDERFEIHSQMLEFLADIGVIDPIFDLPAPKVSDRLIQKQLAQALTPQANNQFAGLTRLYFRIRQDNDRGLAQNLGALLRHYRYVWNKKSTSALLWAGAAMAVRKVLKQMRSMV